MGWTLAEDWLTVTGLVLLTLGSGAQALENLRMFRSMQPKVSGQAGDKTAKSKVLPAAAGEVRGLIGKLRLLCKSNEAFAPYLRLVLLWGVILAGSALTLAAAVIQLVFAYQ